MRNILHSLLTRRLPADGSPAGISSRLPRLGRRAVGVFAAVCATLTPIAFAVGPTPKATTFGSVDVGTTGAPLTITVTATNSSALPAAVAQVTVLTMGNPNLDFQASGTASCIGLTIAAGQSCTQAVTFTPTAPGGRAGAVLLLDSANRVLGVSYISGFGVAGLGVLVPGNMIPVAGQFQTNTSTKDGVVATKANLDEPTGIAVDALGNMFIADSAHNKIRLVSAPVAPATTGTISTYAGTGDFGYAGDNGPATAALLKLPAGVALDGAGNLYVADSGNHVIRKITPAGVIVTVAGNGTPGFAGDGQTDPAQMEFNQPKGVAVDAAGNLYIADTFNQRVRRLDALTGVLTTVAGFGDQSGNQDGKGKYSGDGGLASAADLSQPYAVAFDLAGNMYIADSANYRIRKVDTAGIITTYAGTGSAGWGGDNGLATNAALNNPSGVATDAAGNLYIADTSNSAIRKVNASTGKISSLYINNGGWVLNGAGNPTSASIYAPVGIAVDGKGDVYFADHYDMWVQEIQSSVSLLNYEAKPTRVTDVSTPQTQVIENDGSAPLTLTSVTPDANAQVAATTCLSGPLDIDATCTVTMAFAPSVPGNPLIANVTAEGQTVNSTLPVNDPLGVRLIGIAKPVNSTTTTLASNLNPSDFGQTVTLTATVTTGANTGALTGSVTFMDGTTILQANVAVNSSGIATYSARTLAVGPHSLTATYDPGQSDQAHTGSTSDKLSQTVNEATSTMLSSNGNPAATGQAVTFTATVLATSGGSVPPDGTVTFTDGSTVLGTVAVDASGVAAYSTSTLADGTHAIVATYSGDASNFVLGSMSVVLNEDVQAPSTVSVASAANPSNFGATVTFTATITSGSSLAPTGTVHFLDGGKQIGAASISGTSGAAVFSTTTLAAGSHAITASYLGDSNAGPGVSSPIIQVVNLAQTAASISAAPNPGIAGKAVVLTAQITVTAGSAAPTGTVTFMDGANALGSGAVGANGAATLSSILGPGAHALTAIYGGDANDNGSTSTPLAFQVNLATTSTAVSSSVSPAYALAKIVFSATVSGNGGVPTGTVTFLIDGASAGSAALNSSGVAVYSDSSLTVGTHTVTATYGGDANDSSSSSSAFSQVVQAIPTATSIGQAATGGSTPQAVLVGTVIGTSGPTPTGVVTFTNGSTVVGMAALDSSGVASLTPDLPQGQYTIVASYGGDSIHAPSSSSGMAFTSTPFGFNVSTTPPNVTVQTSKNITLDISISSNNGFADTVGLGCLSLPSGVNCHFSTDTLKLPANGTATAHVTIDTNNPLGGGQSASAGRPGANNTMLAGFFLPPGLLLGWLGWRFRRRNAAWLAAICLLFLSGASLLTGCGGYSQVTAAPGTYTIQVGGVGTNSNVSHYQNVTLTITK